MEEGTFPHARSLQSEKEIEEERRLMYVAITRAKEYLYFSHVYARNLYGASSQTTPSRFLSEFPRELLRKYPVYDEPKDSYRYGLSKSHYSF